MPFSNITLKLLYDIVHIPVFARLTAVDVHLCPPVPQKVMQPQLTGGVVMVKVPL